MESENAKGILIAEFSPVSTTTTIHNNLYLPTQHLVKHERINAHVFATDWSEKFLRQISPKSELHILTDCSINNENMQQAEKLL